MTDIVELAKQAGIEFQSVSGITGKTKTLTWGSLPIESIETFARLVIEAHVTSVDVEPVAHCKLRPLRGDESVRKFEIAWVGNNPIAGPLYTAEQMAAAQHRALEEAAQIVQSHEGMHTYVDHMVDEIRALKEASK